MTYTYSIMTQLTGSSGNTSRHLNGLNVTAKPGPVYIKQIFDSKITTSDRNRYPFQYPLYGYPLDTRWYSIPIWIF